MKKNIYTYCSKLQKKNMRYKELIGHIKNTNQNSAEIETKQEIIVFSPVSEGILEHWMYKIILTKGLAHRGIKLIHGQCNHDFPICDSQLRRIYYPNSEKFQALLRCGNCRAVNETMYDNTDLSHLKLDEYIDKEAKIRIEKTLKEVDLKEFETGKPFEYLGVDMQQALFATLRGFPRGGKMPKKFLKLFLTSCMTAAEAYNRIYQELKPDYLLIFNGKRSVENVALQLGEIHGIRAITFEVGQKIDRLYFDENNPVNSFDKVSQLWEIFKDTPLTKEENELLDDFLNKKKKGITDRNVAYENYANNNENDQNRINQIINELEIDVEKPTAFLASNVMWDSALVGCEKAFNGINDWILETIRYFEKHPEQQLIIRPHPAERLKNVLSLKTLYTIKNLLDDNFKKLPENVKYIPHDSDITSYELFKISDYVLVYNSTIGIEALIENLPVITCTSIFYADKGLSYQVETKEEYFDLLKNSKTKLKPTENQTEFARRLMYCYIFRFGIDFPYIKLGNPPTDLNKLRFGVESFDELKSEAFFDKLKQYFEGEIKFMI